MTATARAVEHVEAAEHQEPEQAAATWDDVGKVAWVSGFLSGTVRSVRNYTRFELLEKMVEVLDVIGWMPGFKQEIPSDKYPSKAEVSQIRRRIAAESRAA